MKCKVHLLSTVLFLSLGASAQTGKLFDADNQLPSSFTNQVYLDHDGFVWVASRNGLSRYDGYQFRIYKKGKAEGMASNYVNAITQDRRGLFFVGMFGALQTYDGIRFRDVDVLNLEGNKMSAYITCFSEQHDGRMLVGTSGCGVLKVETDRQARRIGGDLEEVRTANDLVTDRKGRTWIATDTRGLLVWDGRRVTARYFQESSMAGSVQRVAEDRDGRIYVGTRGHGVFLMGNDGQFHHIDATGSRTVSELYCNREGRMMIGFDGNGMAIYSPENGEMSDNPFYTRDTDLSKAKVESIVEDQGGNIWLGLLQKGLFMQPAQRNGFFYTGYKLGSHNIIGQACVTSTLVDSKGHIWVGTDKDGLYRLTEPYKHYKENFPATVLTMAEDAEGRIWIGTYREGCGYIDRQGQYHRQPLPLDDNVSVFGIAADKRGHIWLGTMGKGLLRLTPSASRSPEASPADDRRVRQYTTHHDAPENRTVNSIVNDYILKIATADDGRKVYVGTTMGACCLDTESESWTSTFGGENCLVYGTAVRTVKEYDGTLWMGTNDGLLCYDLRSHELRKASQDQILAANAIMSLEHDGKGRIWVGTDHGLCCHDPKTGKTESYFVDNGLQANEFSDGASSTAADGRMIFGGVGGITWFNPQEIQRPKWDAEVKLIDFIVNGRPINSQTLSGSHQICDTTVIASDRFQLAYDENHFSIQLSTLTYDNPEHITYMYSINGEPYTSLQRGVNEITFTHLAPGAYRFRIKAERNNQQTAEREFTVIVHAPWYRSGWAYCLYLTLLGLAVWLAVSYRRRKEKDRLRLQEHIHAEELADAKLKFFMNISHEIRTPMTLILSPLQSLMASDDDTRRRSVYKTIRRNAERILSLINQIMDLRKIDKGMMQMRMQETDLIGFVGDIHELFEHQARTKRINFTYQHDDDTLPVWIDRQQFDKVIVNILSNAFKFTPSGGEIGIRINRDDTTATIAVSDNGEQIPEDQLERIFERFYQSPSSVHDRYTGTGIGLDLTRSLVELHHGTVTAHNLDKGCEFLVTIPLGNGHLKAEEMEEMRNEESEMRNDDDQTNPEIPAEQDAVNQEENGMHDSHIPHLSPLTSHLSLVIAEDDDEIRDYLKAELSSDYEVCAASNGREALGEIIREKPDLVISDVMMPEMDGNTLCATIKGNAQMSHIPVILLTAKSRDEDKLEGLETGADAYLVKPFNMDILRRTILNLIDSRRQLQLKYGRNDLLEEQVDDIEMRSPDDKLLERIMKVINHNLRNSDLSVDMIASEVGISRVHLHRKMKDLTGQTPHDFIRNLRLKQAANLLSAGDMNVTEVVYACGFSNVTSFSTTFKKFYGMSPREYMQEHQKRK